MKMRHVQVKLSDQDYRALKTFIAERGLTVQQAVSNAIQEMLLTSRPNEDDLARRRAIIRATLGMYSHLAPGRMLSEELIQERRLEAAQE
ncbi:MAG: hypothetical protein HY235_21340 [Acidobacteria bacterium]|nr:hypothetical protein [Acidobacteriota bacterium]